MSDIVITVIVIVGLGVGVPIALLVARDWLTRPSREQMEEYARQFNERLRNPDFLGVEKHFGCPLPACVQSLYSDREELLRGDFETAPTPNTAPEDRWYVYSYQPADTETVRNAWPGFEEYFAFADDGGGDGYLIDPREEDPAVLFHYHETDTIERVCDHFTEFMRWLRWEPET